MKFIDAQHRHYYEQADLSDSHHRALHYLIGLCPDTRRNAGALFGPDGIKVEAIHAPWQTSGSVRVTRLAFNLYTDGTPTAHRYTADKKEIPVTNDDRRECGLYSPSDLFCCEYAPYFVEAIKLRYPEYFRDRAVEKAFFDSLAR